MPKLSLSDFGRYTLIFAIATQILLFTKNLILNPMIKFAAEPGRFDATCNVGFWLAGGLQLAIFGVLSLLAPVGERIFRLEPLDLVIAGAIPLVFWIRDWGFCAQQAAYRTAKLFIIEAVYWVGTMAGFIWFRFQGNGQIGQVFVIVFACAILSSLASILLWPLSGRFSFRIDRDSLRQLLNYGVTTVGLGLSSALLAGADLIVLGAIYNSEIVGIYGGAKRVYTVVSAMISTVGLLVIPYASRLAAEGRQEEIRSLFEKTVAYLAVGMAGVVGIGWLLATPFYHYVMPASYGDSVPLFRLLLLAAPFEGLFYLTTAILYGIGAASVTLVTSTMALGLLVVVLPTLAYFFGSTGAAVAQVSVTAFVGILMTWRAGQNVQGEWLSTVKRIPTALQSIMSRTGRH